MTTLLLRFLSIKNAMHHLILQLSEVEKLLVSATSMLLLRDIRATCTRRRHP